MSRKDTIIIAILVNAALLVALFVTAIKKDPVEQKMVATPIKELIVDQAQGLPKQPNMEIKTASGDEVDMVLKEFTQNHPTCTPCNQGPVVQRPALACGEKAEDSGVRNEMEIKPTAAFASDSFPSFNQTQPAPEKNEPSFSTWTVKKGDVLEKIARMHRTSVNEIMKLNDLKSTSLRIGQVLKVSAVKVANSGRSQDNACPKEAAPKYYTVKTGDNPWTIAVKNHMKLDELLKLNHLNEEKARRLKPGDQLRIR